MCGSHSEDVLAGGSFPNATGTYSGGIELDTVVM